MKNSHAMKSYLVCLSFVFLLLSCEKDEVTEPIEAPADYASFQLESNYTFRGSLEGVPFSLTYGEEDYQLMLGYENPYGICDTTNFERILECGLSTGEDGKTKFLIYTPAYNVKTKDAYLNIFSVGKKKLGNKITDFFLAIQKGEKQYFSNANSSVNELEILKIEEYHNEGQPRIRVWFKIEANLSDCDCQGNGAIYKLHNGCLLAEFMGYK